MLGMLLFAVACHDDADRDDDAAATADASSSEGKSDDPAATSSSSAGSGTGAATTAASSASGTDGATSGHGSGDDGAPDPGSVAPHCAATCQEHADCCVPFGGDESNCKSGVDEYLSFLCEAGVCRLVTACVSDQECIDAVGQGWVCEPYHEPGEPTCLPGCQSDADCSDGQTCNGRICTSPACTGGDDCPSGAICNLGTGNCEFPECSSDAECGAGWVCVQ